MTEQISFKDEISEIQEIEMGALKELIRICDKHNIKYYLIEGSLLGAIRHGGMIPWDDDIDVGMFRKDFERFLKVVKKEARPPYKCLNYREKSGYIDFITQFVDTGKFVRTSYRAKDSIMNVWVDVFIIDGMPTNKVLHFIHKYKLLYRKLIMMWSDLDHYLVTGRKRSLFEKVLITFCRIFKLNRVINTYKALVKMDKAMICPNDTNTVNFMSEYKWRTEFPKAYYGEGRMVQFGDLTVRIPDKAEEILVSLYGNYMELPPENERYKHSLTLVRE